MSMSLLPQEEEVILAVKKKIHEISDINRPLDLDLPRGQSTNHILSHVYLLSFSRCCEGKVGLKPDYPCRLCRAVSLCSLYLRDRGAERDYEKSAAEFGTTFPSLTVQERQIQS